MTSRRRPAQRAPLSAGAPWRWDGETLVVDIRVQPRAGADTVVGPVDGRVRVRVTAPPVDDAANQRVLRMLAKEFGVARSRVALIAGARSRDKRVSVAAPSKLPRWMEG